MTTLLTTTTPQHPVSPLSRHGRFIGRVGGLAVALGIGLAIANGPAVAAADDDTTTSESSSASAADSTTTSNTPTDTDTDGPSDTDESDQADEDAPDAEDQEEPTRATVEVASPEPEPDPDPGDDPEPADRDDTADDPVSPAPAAAWALAGSARRETAVESPSSSPDIQAEATASPLGTEQQLEAEQIAAETVKTWPVRLMKFVLSVGWLATAHREYSEVDGPDWDNLRQLHRAVDDYAMGAAFQQQLLNPMTPTVVTQVAPPHSWYGQDVEGSRIIYDNPDTIYRFMGVNMTSTYVIKGRFTGALPADTNFSVLTGLSGVTADNLSGRQLEVAEDGSFTITVSGTPAAPGQRNHLQLTADTTLIAVRNTLSDWTTQDPMSLTIERLSGPRNSLFSQLGGFAIPGLGPMVTRSPLLTTLVSLIPAMKDPPRILRGTFAAIIMGLGLGMESKYIKVATTDPATGDRVGPNVLPQPSRNAEFLATQRQSAGYFQLRDDQALVVTIVPGNARYFIVPVTNLWTVTDNYWDQQTSLNNAQAVANPDGSYTFVISPTDPGVHNWVSTGGLNKGTVSIRFQDLDLTSSATPTVSSMVVPVSDLAAVLPATTAYVTAAQRQSQLSIRKAGFDRRFAD